MWNGFNTADYSGQIAETITIPGYNGDTIHAYYAHPLHVDKFPSIVLIPHIPGWDEWCRETARRFAEHGFGVICPNIYERFGHGTPPEIAKVAMDHGLATDETVMGDTKAALDFIKAQPDHSGKCGVIGMCSGGRHTFLAACTIDGFDAAVDCWGGGVGAKPEDATPARPVAPIEYTKDLKCPILGIFGNEDKSPTPEEVDRTEAELKKYGKTYEFHRYDGAGHGIWYYDRPMYRQEQAMDSWNIVLDFFEKQLK